MIMTDFSFLGFSPSDELRNTACKVLERITELAPFGSHPVALLERLSGEERSHYRCAVEVYSRYGPFTARAEKSDAQVAIKSVERALVQKFRAWTEKHALSKRTETSYRQTA